MISGWNGGYMPIDGMPAMILGMGEIQTSRILGVLCTNVSHPHSGALCRRWFYLPNVISDKKAAEKIPAAFIIWMRRCRVASDIKQITFDFIQRCLTRHNMALSFNDKAAEIIDIAANHRANHRTGVSVQVIQIHFQNRLPLRLPARPLPPDV